MVNLRHRRRSFHRNYTFEHSGAEPDWAVYQGTPDWDNTAGHTLGGKAVQLQDNEMIEITYGAKMKNVFCKFRYEIDTIVSSASWTAGWDENPSGAAIYYRTESDDNVTLWVGAAGRGTSTTFVTVVNTAYYVWLDYRGGGTCYLGVSTTDSRPADGTDTSTQYGVEYTDTENQELFKFFFWDQQTTAYFKDVQFSTTPLD